MKLDLGIGGSLVVATLVVYARSIENGFVSIDDPLYIVSNPHVTAGLSWEGVAWAFGHFHSDNWHPLTWISHQLDCTLFGLDAAGHHAVGALLHAANALLLYVLLLRTTGDRWPSAFTAALFALHPLRVESVAWAAERKDVLSGLFFLATLLAYSGYAKRPSLLRYAGVALWLTLGLLAKPMLVTLPLLLLLLDYWPLARGPSLLPSRRLVLEKLPLVAIAAASSLVTVFAQVESGSAQTLDALPLAPRVANALVSYVAYLWAMVWPSSLAVFYPHPALVPGNLPLPLYTAAALALLILAAVTYALWRLRRSRPYLIVGWLWYLGALVPVIGIVQVGIQARADRYTYLPLIGIAIAIAWGSRDAWASRLARRQARDPSATPRSATPALAVASAVLLIGLAVLSALQVRIWRDDFTLYTHALLVTRNNYVAEHNLAAAFVEKNALDRAIEHYRNAIGMRPDYVASYSNLALVMEQRGKADEARDLYREALRIRPDFHQAHVNLGTHLATRGDFEGARLHYEAALRGRPEDVRLMSNLAGVLLRVGEIPAAVEVYERALEVEPGSVELHQHLALALVMDGRADRAVPHYRAALARSPELISAADRLAWLLATHPDAALRDGDEAVELAERANRSSGRRNPQLLVTLAAAYAERGDFAQAIRWQTRAIKLTPAREREPLRLALAGYEAGRAFRQPPSP